MKKWISDVLLTICVSYTILSIVIGFVNASAYHDWDYYVNSVMMFILTGIAVAVLYTHTFFKKWPPAAVMVIQYVLAMGLVTLLVWISGFFSELHPSWFWYLFRSFTIPYVIGAAAFYADTFRAARKANAILHESRSSKKLNA